MPERSASWPSGHAGLLLHAVLTYMDRLTLSVLARRICDDYHFDNEKYGSLDTGLSYAFAAGAFFFGWLVDRIGPPSSIPASSSPGPAPAWPPPMPISSAPRSAKHKPDEQTYLGLMVCRIALGFFESGHRR